jgi:hypothetical protein
MLTLFEYHCGSKSWPRCAPCELIPDGVHDMKSCVMKQSMQINEEFQVRGALVTHPRTGRVAFLNIFLSVWRCCMSVSTQQAHGMP